jgi:hypothetical protein
MKKVNKSNEDTWDLGESESETTLPTIDTTVEAVKSKVKESKQLDAPKPKLPTPTDSGFDLDGLMTDFPTATELQKFVYDQTGIALNLKGRANKLKYQLAMDVLNGVEVDSQFLSNDNPYLDRNEIIPVEPLKDVPPRSHDIVSAGPQVNKFDTNLFPHPDPEWKAQEQNCNVCFRKYANGMITYEILGPIAQRAVGEKLNKYGKMVPEKYIWVDPRTGEQVIRRQDGSYTPLGTKLRNFMKRQRMNNTNQWDVWIDREFVVAEDYITDNPWGTN